LADLNHFSLVLLLLVAPAAGSFLNVLIDRLPRGEDVVRIRSACRGCGARLTFRDLVPVWSFIALRGRCRTCGSAIPAWHLYVEIAAPGLVLLALLAGNGSVGGSAGVIWLTALTLWLLLALGVGDLVWLRLPDALTLGLACLALALAALTDGYGSGPALPAAALGAILGAGSFQALRWSYAALTGREGLGLGDVKLMAGIGALAGPAALPVVVLIGSVLALVPALARAALRHQPPARTARLPFGAALCAAAFVYWLWRAAAF